MSIQLKLDTNAVESLFPEGSEVRVQLQNAVIAEMTKRLYDKAMKEALNEALSGLRAVIDEKAKEVIQEEIAKVENTYSINPKVTLSNRILENIRSQAASVVDLAICRGMADVEKVIEKRIESSIESSNPLRKFDNTVASMTRERALDRAKEVMESLITHFN
ncbi:MAG: hypothetical protein CMN60_21355 [Sphingobium sp.]|nr:hypothetical protein [Sphingobium sp.]MBS50180.1 hypothetical protein [Sphingobium sp.]|tara:strand:- start:30066 stop:30551 length:486 start_codon:yes stop_codon:yes gene_type:complete